ncbi:phage late control protein GPD [compost metagenome]
MITGMNIQAGARIAPDFMLAFDKDDITEVFRERLISLTMTDNNGFEADQLDIELSDSDGRVELPPRGASLSLWLGWQGAALLGKGSFIVDEIGYRGAPDIVTIRGRSADFRGSLNTRREQSWHDTTVGTIVETIAQRNKLVASVASSLNAIAVPHIDQTQESDAVFLSRLAERNGGVVSVKAGKLLFLKKGSAMNASNKSLPEKILERGDGDRHQFTIADREAYTGVTAKWLQTKAPQQQKQNVKLKRVMKAQDLNALQHPDAVMMPTAGKSGGEPGAQNGEYMAGEPENVLKLTTIFATKAQAIRAAQARWEEIQRGVAEFTLTLAIGRADLFPEMPVVVRGFKNVIDDHSWIISRVVHHLNNNGFTTTLELQVKSSDVEYVTVEVME